MVDAGGGGGGGGGGDVEVRQGGIDLLPLYSNARQVLSALPPPFLIYSFPPLKSVFSLISLIWEKQPKVILSLPAGLVSFPKPLGLCFL